MDDVLRALAAPARRRILHLVRDGEMTAGAIAAHFDVTRPAISEHLRVLRESGLLTERREGVRRFYRARPEAMAEVRDYVDRFWAASLDRLRDAAEAEQRQQETDMEQTDALVREVRIDARPDIVFAHLTDPQRMVRWMGVSADLDPKPGGVYDVRINSVYDARGEFVAVEPNSRVVFTWGWVGNDGVPPGSSTVEFTLEPDGDGTLLRLRHSGLPDAASVASHDDGWQHYMARLATASAGGDPGPDPMAKDPEETTAAR
jgi:uncharacterized protein YndB with AHSA1/START domain/DNA-binding transcriptional ArsR family regulator